MSDLDTKKLTMETINKEISDECSYTSLYIKSLKIPTLPSATSSTNRKSS